MPDGILTMTAEEEFRLDGTGRKNETTIRKEIIEMIKKIVAQTFLFIKSNIVFATRKILKVIFAAFSLILLIIWLLAL